MRKSQKKLTLNTPKLPNISFSGVIMSARSATETVDTPSNLITPFTPGSNHIRQESLPFKRAGLLSPSPNPFNMNKPRKSISDNLKPSTGVSPTRKVFTHTDKNFHSNFDIPKESAKVSVKLVTPRRKIDDLVNLMPWDNDQSSTIKKLLFSFQEMRSKFADIGSKVESFGVIFAQLLTQIENGVYTILASLCNTLNASYAEEAKLQKKLSEAHENLKNFEANHQMKNKQEYERLEKMKKDLTQQVKNKDLEDNSQYFIIQKLKNENEYIEKKLENLLKFSDLNNLNKELEQTRADNKLKSEQYEGEIRDRELLLARVEIMYHGTKKANENLVLVNKEMEARIMQLHNNSNSHQRVLELVEEEKNMYRERSMMQLADYEGLQLELEEMQDNFVRMRDRYLLEREKSDKLNNLFALQEKSDSTFEQEAQFLESIKNSVYSGPGKHLNLRKEQDKEKPNEWELKHYMFSKPTYQSLFDKNKAYLKMKDSKINVDFVAMLRAIYDSKYNEILSADNHTQVSRFPDFVYSWIGKFMLDAYSRQVRSADLTDPDPEIMRNEIITLLHSPFASKLWECITFKEFLDEVHTRDELAYFLYCRHLVFKGPQLSNSSSTFIFNYYIKIEWADYVLNQLLGYKHSEEAINLMKQRFRERGKQKKGQILIDSAFFLRVLLEEYKKEKLEKFSAYKKALTKDNNTIASSNGKFNISFETFRGFLNAHFPETYDLEKAELYRKCWVFTNGNIDIDGMLLVLNEENFFSKSLTFSSLEGKFVPQNLPARYNEKLIQDYSFIVKKYQVLEEHMDFLHQGIEKLGVERYLGDFQEMERCMKNYFAPDNSDFQGKDTYLILKILFLRCYKLNNALLYMEQTQKEKNINDHAKNVFLTFKENFERYLDTGDDQLREFELNVKAKKLQKFFRSKISSWYKLMKLLIKTRLKKFCDEKGNMHFKNS